MDCANLSSENSLAVYLSKLRRSNDRKVRESRNYWIGKSSLLRTNAVINGSVATTHWCGRLGNTMFQIASIIGIAKRNSLIPVVDGANGHKFFGGLRFANTTTGINISVTAKRCIIREPGVGIYVKETENLAGPCKGYEAVGVSGCLQSWKYFQNVDHDVRRMLTFKISVYRTAELRIFEGMRSLWKDPRNRNVVETVGVHVRRSDFTHPGWIEIGAVSATDGYFVRTIAELELNATAVMFVVGDDYEYCKRLFTGYNMFILDTSPIPEVDMALLHMMDRLIISSGTFGWWSAYLGSAKEVYYYKNWPRAGSRLQNELRHEDYFLPQWNGRA
ncbi:hypothetical protein RvY_02895 [Ramazzottius varieornatus]|uniref:L-Fucosyltransferase n=1 Tax=Ramazzottius varieornatus TaxID=947166 RepID=A0A1D1UWE7_RAMVA|nr:hypothetical protein RvY_02895 [Ramazzottius varieornatus]